MDEKWTWGEGGQKRPKMSGRPLYTVPYPLLSVIVPNGCLWGRKISSGATVVKVSSNMILFLSVKEKGYSSYGWTATRRFIDAKVLGVNERFGQESLF